MARLRIALGVAALVLGVLAILCGLGSASAVAGIDMLVGRSGVVMRDMGMVSGGPGDVAVVVDGVKADITAGDLPPLVTRGLDLAGTSPGALIAENGTFTLLATPPGPGEAFLALGSPADVDDYLYGHPYAVAELESGGSWREISVPGEGSPPPPTEHDWVRSASGRPAQLPAGDLAGQTLVVMRSDAAAPAAADLRLEYRVPEAPAAIRSAAVTATAAGVGGLLLILLGAWCVVGRKPRGRHA